MERKLNIFQFSFLTKEPKKRQNLLPFCQSNPEPAPSPTNCTTNSISHTLTFLQSPYAFISIFYTYKYTQKHLSPLLLPPQTHTLKLNQPELNTQKDDETALDILNVHAVYLKGVKWMLTCSRYLMYVLKRD